MSTNGQKIVDFMLTFSGKKDDPIYREWFYGKKGITTADCAVFGSFGYAKNGFPLGKGDYLNGWASVPNALKHYTATNEVIPLSYAQPGDILILGWDGKTPEHWATFIKFNPDGTIHTVEANTSNPAAQSTSEANGGWTMEKNRPKKFVIACIHPKILDVPQTA